MEDTTPRTVKIAGKDYAIHYALGDLRKIEAHAEGPGRNMTAMLGGSFAEKLAVIWGGIGGKGTKNKGTRTIDDVEELLQQHVDEGGNWDVDVFLTCAEVAVLSGMTGKPDPKKVKRVMALARQAAGLVDDDDETEDGAGKTVRAAE